MKPIYLLLSSFILVIAPSSASAQAPGADPAATPPAPLPPEPVHDDSHIHLGLRVGLNLSSLGGDDVDDSQQNRRVGFAFGGFMVIEFGSMVGFQPEIYYSMQGNELVDGRGTLELDYIQVPLLLRMKLPVQRTVGVHLVAGPSIGVLVSAEGKRQGSTVDLKSITDSFDIGAALGAGIDIPLQQGGINLEARYTLGLRSIDDVEDSDIKNRVASFLVGYYF